MRTHDFIVDRGLDFSGLDARMIGLLERSAEWLRGDDAHRARLGLHELLVNIRRHAYRGEGGPISVAMTASATGLTVLVTDWGGILPAPTRRPVGLSATGGYGLGIIEQAFSGVEYRRACGRNEWVLSVHAADLIRR